MFQTYCQKRVMRTKPALQLPLRTKNLSSRGFRRIRATCNKRSEQPKKHREAAFPRMRLFVGRECRKAAYTVNSIIFRMFLQIALSDSAKRRQIMYNHTNPRSGFAAGLSRTAGNMRRTAAKTLSDARTKLGRKSKEKRRRANAANSC